VTGSSSQQVHLTVLKQGPDAIEPQLQQGSLCTTASLCNSVTGCTVAIPLCFKKQCAHALLNRGTWDWLLQRHPSPPAHQADHQAKTCNAEKQQHCQGLAQAKYPTRCQETKDRFVRGVNLLLTRMYAWADRVAALASLAAAAVVCCNCVLCRAAALVQLQGTAWHLSTYQWPCMVCVYKQHSLCFQMPVVKAGAMCCLSQQSGVLYSARITLARHL
jgi:hypothetical protein